MLPRHALSHASKHTICLPYRVPPALRLRPVRIGAPSFDPTRPRFTRLVSPLAHTSLSAPIPNISRCLHTASPQHGPGRKPSDEEGIHDVSSTAAALAYGSLRKQGTIRNLRLQPKPKPKSNKASSDDAWTREALAQREGSPVTPTPTPPAPGAAPDTSPSGDATAKQSNTDSSDSPPQPPPDRAGDLLKLRSLEQADKGSPRPPAPTPESSEPQMIIDLPAPAKKTETTPAANPSSSASSSASSSSSSSSSPSSNSNSSSSASPSTDETPSTTSPPASAPSDGGAEYLREPHQNLTPIMHLIDTRAFAQQLARSGWAGVGDKEQQDRVATILAEGVEEMLVERLNQSRREHISSVDVEYQSYVFRLSLNEVKTELEVRARNDGASLRSMTQVLQREVDRLSQKAREDVDNMQHTIQVAMNESKTEVKGQQNDQEQTVQDLKHKLTIVVSTLKTGLEHSLKWDLSRRAFLLLFGQICFFFTVFKLFSLSSKKDKGKGKGAQSPDATALPSSAARPQSAEDIGLVPHYDNQGVLSTA